MPVTVDNPRIQPAGYAFSIWGVDLPVAVRQRGVLACPDATPRPMWDAGAGGLFCPAFSHRGLVDLRSADASGGGHGVIWLNAAGALWALSAAAGTRPGRGTPGPSGSTLAGAHRRRPACALGERAEWGMYRKTAHRRQLGHASARHPPLGPLTLRLRTHPPNPIAVACALVGIVVANGRRRWGLRAESGRRRLLFLAVRQGPRLIPSVVSQVSRGFWGQRPQARSAANPLAAPGPSRRPAATLRASRESLMRILINQ